MSFWWFSHVGRFVKTTLWDVGFELVALFACWKISEANSLGCGLRVFGAFHVLEDLESQKVWHVGFELLAFLTFWKILMPTLWDVGFEWLAFLVCWNIAKSKVGALGAFRMLRDLKSKALEYGI